MNKPHPWGDLVSFRVTLDDEGGERFIAITGEHDNGQLTLIGTFSPGPFDTNLEIAQWVWRSITRAIEAVNV